MRFLFLLFIIMPIVEMVVLIKVGGLIGLFNTVMLVLLTAVIGVSLLKRQGLETLLRANQRMQSGDMPVEEMAEGIMLAVAGALLLTPGFVTDTIGFCLLAPQIRMVLAKRIMKVMVVAGASQFSGGFYSAPMNQDTPFDNVTRTPDGNIIEGEFREEKGDSEKP